jgi:OPT family oligopeptide transporter
MAEETHTYPEPDLTSPQFTIRAILTGMLLGGLLSLCNVYMGLKIGWGFNMSITAALLSFGIYRFAQNTFRTREWSKLENNINQTAASSAASISSAGLVAPIPALTLLTGHEMELWELMCWCLSVALVGVAVAIGLRKQMLLRDKLSFPLGVAAGQTLKEMYAKGEEAMARVKMLLTGAFIGAAAKLFLTLSKVSSFAIPMKAKGIAFSKLTFAINPSPLFVAMGAIVGVRAGLSMLVGAFVGWLIIAPRAIEAGYIGGTGFAEIVKWLLWPGVAMMVAGSLTSFAFSWRAVLSALTGTRRSLSTPQTISDDVSRPVFISIIIGVLGASVFLQFQFFDIGWGIATCGILLTFVLAVVAGRVSGETGITPVGPMGKVTQLTFGAIDPSNVSANLMAANVTGGAASQCGDLLHDLKCGLMVGASPRLQTYAQFLGVLAGAICGAIGYKILVGDAAQLQAMYADEEWAMPAVIQWKAVAEIFQGGVENLPAGAVPAMIAASVLGIVLAILEKVLPKKAVNWVPSPTAFGLALVIPASYSISIAIGGLLSWYYFRVKPKWSQRFTIALAAGVIAGDSLTGVSVALLKIAGIPL